jgi:hypothetical protein
MTTKTERAILEDRTMYEKLVIPVATYNGNILKSAQHNTKLGKGKALITKGPWSGFPLFTLTLEERKTCPSSCHHYNDCYGNNMFRAHRYKNDENLIPRLRDEIASLDALYKGFVVRLHVLGDFYSVEYVRFWAEMLQKYSGLHIYGYTARNSGDIGEEIIKNLISHSRVCLRFSVDSTIIERLNPNIFTPDLLATDESVSNIPLVVCPEQTEQTDSCLTCGLCFNKNFRKAVKFLDH